MQTYFQDNLGIAVWLTDSWISSLPLMSYTGQDTLALWVVLFWFGYLRHVFGLLIWFCITIVPLLGNIV